MLEALWSVKFTSSFGIEGNGIVVFETGRIFGGDSSMIYIGDYEVKDEEISGEINVQKYADVSGMFSAVGLNNFTLKITGKLGAETMILSGYVIEDAKRTIEIHATRRADLP